jgi:hypothetical protein
MRRNRPTGAAHFSIVGGVRSTAWSFIHIDHVATATAAVEGDGAGTFNVVDDDPAPVAHWLPVLAEAVGAKPPLRNSGAPGAPDFAGAPGSDDD